MFFAIDVDHSGSISMDEFGNALSKLGLNLSPEDVSKVFPLFDADGSGELSIDGFVAMQKNEIELQNANKLIFNNPRERMKQVNMRSNPLLDQIKKKAVTALRSGGVRLQRTASTDMNPLLQGNADMLTLDNLVKRYELKDNKIVVSAINRFWEVIEKKVDGTEVDRDTFIQLITILHNKLVPDAEAEQVQLTAEQDWRLDVGDDDGSMDRSTFLNSMFELCDT